MADTRLSDLSAASALAASDLFYVVQSAGSGGAKATGTQLLTLVGTTYLATATAASTYLPLAGGTLTGLLTITQGTANASVIASTGYSLTGSDATPMVDLAGTWNTSGTPTALKLNVTDTGSASESLLLDLQVSGTSKFNVNKLGIVTTTNTVAIGNNVFLSFPSVGSKIRQGLENGNFTIKNSTEASKVYFGLDAGTEGTFAVKDGSTASVLRVYGLYTDASNYERLGLNTVAGTSVELAAETAGTGGDNLNIVLTPAGTGKVTSAATLQLSTGTLTGASKPALDISQTWNDAAVTFVGANINVVPTASASGSRIFKVQQNSYDLFTVSTGGAKQFHSTNGTATAQISSDGSFLVQSTASIAFNGAAGLGGSPDVYMYRGAAGTLDQRNGANAQAFRVYNAYTDSSNYERAAAEWSSGTFYVRTQNAGTGAARALALSSASNSMYFNVGSVSNLLLLNASATGAVTVNAPTLTGSSSNIAVNVAQTWNTTGTPTLIFANVTDTASNASSLLMDLQVGGASMFKVTKGGDILRAGANAQSTGIYQLSELTTIAAAATTDTAIQMPAGAIILGVTVRVTTAVTCTSTFDVGDSGSATRFGTGISKAANTTNVGSVAPFLNASALSVRITPDTVPSDNTGRVRVTIHYMLLSAATS